jgi:hypothetical protein
MINEKISRFICGVIKIFTVFPEYFISISIIYILTVVLLVSYSVYGLILQKSC